MEEWREIYRCKMTVFDNYATNVNGVFHSVIALAVLLRLSLTSPSRLPYDDSLSGDDLQRYCPSSATACSISLKLTCCTLRS